MSVTETTQDSKTNIDLYADINSKFIEHLQRGKLPWRPWQAGLPQNLISKLPYQGINALILGMQGYEQNLFLTYRQLEKIGGKVKLSEKNNGHKVLHVDQNPHDKSKFVVKHYYVFNIAQCEDIAAEHITHAAAGKIHVAAEDIVANMDSCPPISHKQKNAFYNPKEDFINLPKKISAKKDAGYYDALFHQLVHSTGHHSRLNRETIAQMPEFGTDLYVLEELTAKIGACFLQSIAGIDGVPLPGTVELLGWRDKLLGDKFFIFKAAKAAQKAVNYILGTGQADTKEPEQ